MRRGIERAVAATAIAMFAWTGAATAQGSPGTAPAAASSSAAASPATAGTQATAAATTTKVVVQVSDDNPRTWNLALNNLRNLQNELGATKVVAELVAYGPGIGMLQRESSVEARITQALADGVRVVACENTMRGRKLTPPDMIPGIGYVPSGVVEIVERERDGYAYLRP